MCSFMHLLCNTGSLVLSSREFHYIYAYLQATFDIFQPKFLINERLMSTFMIIKVWGIYNNLCEHGENMPHAIQSVKYSNTKRGLWFNSTSLKIVCLFFLTLYHGIYYTLLHMLQVLQNVLQVTEETGIL